MIQTLRLLLQQIAVCLKSRAELHIENLVLRHQIEILRRSAPPRVRLTRADRFLFTWFIRVWPKVSQSVRIVHPKTPGALASPGLQDLLALEITASRWPAKGIR